MYKRHASIFNLHSGLMRARNWCQEAKTVIPDHKICFCRKRVYC